MGGFFDFYREKERRANTTERVSVEGGPVLWDAAKEGAERQAVTIRAGDAVLHRPSGETWTVKRVLGDRLEWCGWPPGQARTADCTLVKACSDAEHQAMNDYVDGVPGAVPRPVGELAMVEPVPPPPLPRWIPTSERRRPHQAIGRRFPFVDAHGGEHYGAQHDGDGKCPEEGDAWWCEVCLEWYAAAEVMAWYDLPAPPCAPANPEGVA